VLYSNLSANNQLIKSKMKFSRQKLWNLHFKIPKTPPIPAASQPVIQTFQQNNPN
jgi:hypothetical protein